MKFNPRLKQDIERFKDYIILVKGNKDTTLMKSFGFDRVFPIHKTSVPLKERIEQICKHIEKRQSLHPHRSKQKRKKTLHVRQTNSTRMQNKTRLIAPRSPDQSPSHTHRRSR